jgi:hypothetical protein
LTNDLVDKERNGVLVFVAGGRHNEAPPEIELGVGAPSSARSHSRSSTL